MVEVYHPFVWRGWTDFGSGAVGDIAPHHMNVIFMALDLGAPSAVEVVECSGMKKEMYPQSSVIRFSWPQRGSHPPFQLYWYDGGNAPPERITAVSQLPPLRARRAGYTSALRHRRAHLDRHQGQPAAEPRTVLWAEGGSISGAAAERLGPAGRVQGLGRRGPDRKTTELQLLLLRSVYRSVSTGKHRFARGPQSGVGFPGVSSHQLPGSKPVSPARIQKGLGPEGDRGQRSLQRMKGPLWNGGRSRARTADLLGVNHEATQNQRLGISRNHCARLLIIPNFQ